MNLLSTIAMLSLHLWGCSSSTPEAPAPDPAPAAEAHPETPQIDVAQLEAEADEVALVPSPVETQKALEASGIDTKLATLIPKHQFDLEADSLDHAAVRTGVLLADVLLTVKSAKTPQLVQRITAVQKGMNQLGGGDDISRTLDDIKERLKADAVTRDDLLKEFDELSGVVIPELEFNGQDRVVPLIEAGSWLEGANLVARAVKQSGNKAAAETLLKSPSVVDYFIEYVKTDGADKAPEAVTKKLEESLLELKAVASKAEPLDDADIDKVIQVTNAVLALL
jgi:hypothetical protein